MDPEGGQGTVCTTEPVEKRREMGNKQTKNHE